MAFVYSISATSNDDIRFDGYIGVTSCSLNKRFNAHKSQYLKFCNGQNVGCKKLYANIKNRGGWNNVIIKIICEASFEYCLELEHRLRKQPNIGWNTRVGGNFPVMYQRKISQETKLKLAKIRQSWKMSDDTKLRMSSERVGLNNPMFGTHPWNNPSSTFGSKKTWLFAREIYIKWEHSKMGVKKLSEFFPELNYHSIDSMIRRFRKGWIPNQDNHWLEYRGLHNDNPG